MDMNIYELNHQIRDVSFETLKSCNVKELRQMCRDRRIYGHTKFKRRLELIHYMSSLICPQSDIQIDIDVFGIIAQYLDNRNVKTLFCVCKAMKSVLFIDMKRRFEDRKRRAKEELGSLPWCQKIFLQWIVTSEKNTNIYYRELSNICVTRFTVSSVNHDPTLTINASRLAWFSVNEYARNELFAMYQLIKWNCITSDLGRVHWGASYTITEINMRNAIEKLKEFED